MGWTQPLRTLNLFRPHRQVRFKMPTDEASKWRDSLVAALKKQSSTARTAGPT